MRNCKSLALGALFTAALVLAGCIETKDTITLNPDGSGKAELNVTTPPTPNFGGNATTKPNPETMAKQAVANLLRDTKGVEAWSDVSYKVTDDGKTNIKATAYFPDINKFKTEMGMKASWEKSPKGGMLLELKPEKGPASRPATAPSDADIAAKVKQEKREYQQNKAVMQVMLGTLKLDTTYVLPGTVSDVSIFTQAGNKVELVVDGKKLMDSMDKMMADDKKLTEMIKAGETMEDPEPGMEAMFGKKGPIAARATADKPLFDYKAEAAKAKAGQDAMLKKLGIDLKAPASGPSIRFGN